MKHLLLCISFFFSFLSVFSQKPAHYVFSTIDAAQGLSDNRVRYVLQLPDERLVITTDEGLNLYDGTSFTYLHRGSEHLYPLHGYTGSYREYLYNDSLLWIKDYGRLMCVNFRHETYEAHADSLFSSWGVSDLLHDLFVDDEKNLWMLTRKDELYVKRNGMQRATLFCTAVSRPSGSEDPLYDLILHQGNLYLFYQSGLMVCRDALDGKERFRSEAFSDTLSRARYGETSLVLSASDGFYQLRNGHSQGVLLHFDCETRRWKPLLETAYSLNSLVEARDAQKIWIAHQHGLLGWDMRTKSVTHIPVLRLVDGREIHTTLNTLCYDLQGGLWVGTLNRGLLYYHPSRFRVRHIGRALFPERPTEELLVQGIVGDAHGTIYLWCNDSDYYQYDKTTGRMERGVPTPAVRDALRNSSAGTSFRGKTYSSLCTDLKGRVWCGTSDGLKLWSPKEQQWRTFYTEDGLINNSIRALLQDKAGAIWVSTGRGISRITEDGTGNFHFMNLDPLDGVLEGEFCVNSAWAAPDGALYFGGLDGFNRIDPERITSDTTVLTPLFVSFELYGSKVKPGVYYGGRLLLEAAPPYTRELVLNYDQNFFTVVFSALNYINPSQTNYRYRLLGVDGEWREQRSSDGRLHAVYTDLKPGKYRFQVYAATGEKKWNGPCAELEITIESPYWATSWAYAVYLLCGIGVLSAVFYLLIRQKKRRMERAHQEEILLLRIRGLLEQCDRYQEQLSLEPERTEIKGSPLPAGKVSDAGETETEPPALETVAEKRQTNEFLNRVIEQIEQNLDNTGYSVEQLSRDLCMDRTGLYRKLTQLVDQSPTLLIRSIRLQRAAQLLASESLPVAEIAFRTGFSSAAYFSKCFQEEYGMKPSRYAAEKRGESQAL